MTTTAKIVLTPEQYADLLATLRQATIAAEAGNVADAAFYANQAWGDLAAMRIQTENK